MEKRGFSVLGAALLLFAAFGYGLPIFHRVSTDLHGFRAEAFYERYLEIQPIVRLSLMQATASTLLCALFALAAGFFLYRHPLRLLLVLFRGTFFFPSLLVVHFTLYWLSESEYRYGFFSVLFAHFLLNGFWLAAETIEAYRQLPRIEMETARTLGADRFSVYRDLAVPSFLLRLRNPLLLVFSLCFSSFSLVMILGGGPPIQSLETEMYEALRLGTEASENLLPLYTLQATAGCAFALLLRSHSRPQTRARHRFVLSSTVFSHVLSGALPGLFLLFLLTPFLGYFSDFSVIPLLENESFVASVLLSVRIGATASALLSFVVFLFLLNRSLAHRTAAFSAFLSGLSPFLIAASFLAFYPALDRGEGNASFWALVLLTVLTQFAFQFRFLFAWREAESFAPFEVARTLGANPFRAFRDLLLPRWKWIALSVIASAFFFGFTESAVSFLYGGAEVVPFSVWLARSEARYAFREADAAQFFLLVLWFLLVALQWCVQMALQSRGAERSYRIGEAHG